MARAMKCRRVCLEPRARVFRPEGAPPGKTVTLSVEELESLRLCDMEGLGQDEAAQRMNVSRGTFQRILYSARKTVASALVAGESLAIGGGNYEVATARCRRGKTCCQCRFAAQKNEKEM